MPLKVETTQGLNGSLVVNFSKCVTNQNVFINSKIRIDKYCDFIQGYITSFPPKVLLIACKGSLRLGSQHFGEDDEATILSKETVVALH